VKASVSPGKESPLFIKAIVRFLKSVEYTVSALMVSHNFPLILLLNDYKKENMEKFCR
jgi:hypothetical protein